MGRYDHSLSLDAAIMVSKNCPTIGEHVVTIFVTQKFRKIHILQVIQITLEDVKSTLIQIKVALNSFQHLYFDGSL